GRPGRATGRWSPGGRADRAGAPCRRTAPAARTGRRRRAIGSAPPSGCGVTCSWRLFYPRRPGEGDRPRGAPHMLPPDEVAIETPEQIDLMLEPAGLGARFVAWVIDWLWKLLALL